MRRILETGWPTLLVGSACAGIVLSVWVRPPLGVSALVALAALGGALVARDTGRLALAAVALACAGLWWGTIRGEALDRSFLVERLGQEAPARVVVTGPARKTPFALRVPAEVIRFGPTSIRERVLLELPPERAPPQGAVLELRARPVAPRGPETGFDERGWLARRGVHVVVHGERARVVGRRGGIGGVADRLHAHVEETLARGTAGERRRLLAGIVLGEDSGVDRDLVDAFRASGLMHLLAVSGQNVGITAIGVRRGRAHRRRRPARGRGGRDPRDPRVRARGRAGSRPSSVLRSRARSRRSRGSPPARATAGTRSASAR